MLCPQDAVRKLLLGQLESQPELLDHLGTIIHPRSLKKEGVTVYSILQVCPAGHLLFLVISCHFLLFHVICDINGT